MARDPYPLLKYQNDNDFRGPPDTPIKSFLQGKQTQNDQEPWSRLHRKATLASARRGVRHFDAQAPNDSLDFVIKSTYDHHTEFQSSKAQSLLQQETLGLPHGRILKNRPGPEEPDPDPENLPMKIATTDVRRSLYSTKGAIPSHHSEATNRGYSRKHDGGFYTC